MELISLENKLSVWVFLRSSEFPDVMLGETKSINSHASMSELQKLEGLVYLWRA
jgi:hypothetical protein